MRLQELKKQEKQKLKASFALLNTVNKPADQTCWLVNAFLEKGADVNIADADGSTPLSLAAAHGNVGAVKLLCDAGAHLGETDCKGYTALASFYRSLWNSAGSYGIP